MREVETGQYNLEGRIIQAPFAAPPHLPLRPGTPLTLIGESLQVRMQLLIADLELLPVTIVQGYRLL